jgi:membrane fusion protein (multidrug efflux system)
MSTAFSRTARALATDGFRGSFLALIFSIVLLAAWLGWFFFAQIPRYEVTSSARLEVDQEVRPVQSPVLARIVTSNLQLGREVHAGDVLVELDSATERFQVQEETAHVTALTSEIASLHAQVFGIMQSRIREQQSSRIAEDQATAKFREADTLARSATDEAHRLDQLHKQDLIPRREYDQGQLEAERRRQAAESLRLEAGRLQQGQGTRESDRQVQSENLAGEIRKLEGEQATARASIDRLNYEVERRVIRAPISGKLAEVAELRPGGVVEEADRLCAILPEGRLRTVAEFAPSDALGRIRPGQSARLRLDGFPWTQYGSIATTVSNVAGEIRDGKVRVELSLTSTTPLPINLQHGLPGAVEVEVERLTPAQIVLRAAGQMLTAPRSSVANSR